MARPTKYEKEIKPHIEDIRKAVESGATDKEIATAFGIAESTLYKYKKEKPEFSAAFARGREKVCIEIKAALLKKALGFEYTEEKSVAKHDKDGDAVVMVETYKKYQPPSETAAAMLLRNYDSDWRDNDNAAARLKQQEIELKQAIAKATNFDIELD